MLVSVEILQISHPARSEREKIITFLNSLAGNPGMIGDFSENDSAGRPVQIKIIGKLALTYWADHSEKEIKVVRIEPADKY